MEVSRRFALLYHEYQSWTSLSMLRGHIKFGIPRGIRTLTLQGLSLTQLPIMLPEHFEILAETQDHLDCILHRVMVAEQSKQNLYSQCFLRAASEAGSPYSTPFLKHSQAFSSDPSRTFEMPKL